MNREPQESPLSKKGCVKATHVLAMRDGGDIFTACRSIDRPQIGSGAVMIGAIEENIGLLGRDAFLYDVIDDLNATTTAGLTSVEYIFVAGTDLRGREAVLKPTISRSGFCAT
jgi:hypothetical protein